MKARRTYRPRQTDPAVARQEAKRFAARFSKGLLLAGAIVALVVIANRWGAREELHAVRIVGRVVLDSAEIMEPAQIPAGIPLKRLDLMEVERRIESNPFIARATAFRGENGSLVIEVVERQPVALSIVEGSPIYLDSQGVALPFRFSSAQFDVPVVSGVVSEGRIDSAKAVEAISIVRRVRDFDEVLYRQLAEFRRESNGEYTLLTAEAAVPVRTGYPDGIETRLGKLDLFLRTAAAAHGLSSARSVDLRWRGQVVVRWRDHDRT